MAKRRLYVGLTAAARARRDAFKPGPQKSTTGPFTRSDGNRISKGPGGPMISKVGQSLFPKTKADQGITWTNKFITNDVAGNPRQGSRAQVGYDPVTGQKYHRYPVEAGGMKAEVIGVKQTQQSKAAHKKRLRQRVAR
jgi:hypothetical protein